MKWVTINLLCGLSILLLISIGSRAEAADQKLGITTRVSVNTTGLESNDLSASNVISSNGSVVAFASDATNLVDDDTNTAGDVFYHNLYSNETERVSIHSSGDQGNGASGTIGTCGLSISADGNSIAFVSEASNLVDEDNNNRKDVFVHNIVTGETVRVSIDSRGNEGSGDSINPSISADGRYVAFVSQSRLDPNDNQYGDKCYLHDTITGETRYLTPGCGCLSISGDGRFVAFETVAFEKDNIAVFNIETKVIDYVTVNEYGQLTDGNYFPAISFDGRYVAFQSTWGFDGGLANIEQIYVKDLQSRHYFWISVPDHGTPENRLTGHPSISHNGRFVAFVSGSSNLVDGDNNQTSDIFVRDIELENTYRVSIATNGIESNYSSGYFANGASISPDGLFTSFMSGASNLVGGDNNGVADIFVHNLTNSVYYEKCYLPFLGK